MNRNSLIALKTKEKFIRKIAPMVQEVFCDCRGVNPSVVIAQAILESGYGTSHLAKKNNIFGLNNYHDGYLINAGDILIEVPQEKDGIVYYQKEYMAKFDNLMDCIKSLKKWYTRPKYIEPLREAGTDSIKQITAIKNCGYATDSGYVGKITSIISNWNLKQYDVVYTIQCGAYSIESNAIAEVKRLNKLFKTNQFYIDYSDYYRVYYNKTHDKNSCMEWLNANRNILPKGSFIKEI